MHAIVSFQCKRKQGTVTAYVAKVDVHLRCFIVFKGEVDGNSVLIGLCRGLFGIYTLGKHTKDDVGWCLVPIQPIIEWITQW